MFEYKKPQFTRGRIMTREILQCIVDAPFSYASLQYESYSDGVIVPVKMTVTGDVITIDGGLIKYGNRLYRILEPSQVEYYPTEEWR